MCGRFTLRVPAGEIIARFGLKELAVFAARFNIAPSQSILAIRPVPPPEEAATSAVDHGMPSPAAAGWQPWEGAWLSWGLVPGWAKDPGLAAQAINARAETVATKPAFRSAFKKRRCLILADGFYEWETVGKQKIPYHIRRRDGDWFAFAGLWERWKGVTPPLESCTILTTEARGVIAGLHQRMPVILAPEDYADWLDTRCSAERLAELVAPVEPRDFELLRLSTHVNNVRRDDPACLSPAPKTLFD